MILINIVTSQWYVVIYCVPFGVSTVETMAPSAPNSTKMNRSGHIFRPRSTRKGFSFNGENEDQTFPWEMMFGIFHFCSRINRFWDFVFFFVWHDFRQLPIWLRDGRVWKAQRLSNLFGWKSNSIGRSNESCPILQHHRLTFSGSLLWFLRFMTLVGGPRKSNNWSVALSTKALNGSSWGQPFSTPGPWEVKDVGGYRTHPRAIDNPGGE